MVSNGKGKGKGKGKGEGKGIKRASGSDSGATVHLLLFTVMSMEKYQCITIN